MDSPDAILVIDDDDEYLSYVASVLKAAGCRYRLASSAYVARKIIREDRPGIVLTDLRLPGASGIELIGETLERDPTAVVLVMTAFGSVEAALACLKKGAYDFLLKPSSPEEIGAAVERAVDHRMMRAELVRKTAELETFKRDYRCSNRVVEEISSALAPLTRRPDVPIDVRGLLDDLRRRMKPDEDR
jgi:DNA-binding NtrC family response regulator